jgi:hypothetical protein
MILIMTCFSNLYFHESLDFPNKHAENHSRNSHSNLKNISKREPMAYDALKKQELKTKLRSKYVFLNPDNKPIEIETLRKNAWTKGLQNAAMTYRHII